MSTVNRIAAAEAVNPAAPAAGSIQSNQSIVYQGETNGWRNWTGTTTALSADGVQITGVTTGLSRQVSQTGQAAVGETFNTITAADGSKITVHTAGPVNRATGEINMTGTVTEATGAFAHLLGQTANRKGVLVHRGGPSYVPGQSFYDGVLTIGGAAPAVQPQKAADLSGKDLREAPRRTLANVASPSLVLVPPRV